MKKLLINLEICSKCKECAVSCGYFYHPQEGFVSSLFEYATFSTICRHCEQAPCVSSCYRDALERQPDGHLKRYLMRCTSCKSCTIACPFGVILPEYIPYLSAKCDYCIGRADKEPPECVTSCPQKAVEFKEVEEDLTNNMFLVGTHLAVKGTKWFREDKLPQKK
ncbi:MAG: 4Fe-4S binding protein [Candidatus Omnitrophota bacterium]|nr:4Fe-4S binding protein [Candidatus Omnitrophota bacterium]